MVLSLSLSPTLDNKMYFDFFSSNGKLSVFQCFRKELCCKCVQGEVLFD